MDVKVSTMSSTLDNAATENTIDNNASDTTLTPNQQEGGEVEDAQPSPAEVVEGQGLDANAVKVVELEAPVKEPIAEEEFTFSIPDEETPSETTQQQAKPEEKPATTSWQDVIKSVPKKEIAKALGLSDFALEIDEHIAKGGQAIDYLRAKSVDYTKVSDTDIIKDNLRKELPNATNAQLDLYISRKYHQTEFAEEDEKMFGELSLQRDANQLRQELIAKQQSFKIPETPVNTNQAEWKQQQQAAIQQAEREAQESVNRILNHEATQKLITDKRVVIDLGEGNKPLNVKLDDKTVNYLNRLITDGETYNKAVHNAKGEPNVALMQKIAFVIANPNYAKDIFNAGKKAGEQSLVEENQNIKKPNGAPVVDMKPPKFAVRGTSTIGSH